jgi:hypothetical protein
MVWLLKFIRRRDAERNWAADGMRQFLELVERKGLLKDKMRLLKRKIIGVQRECRSFLARKRSWVLVNSALWMNVEDKQLQDFYLTVLRWERKEQQEASNQMQRSDSVNPLALQLQMAAKKEQEGTGWKIYRIPLNHRKFQLGRWYMRQLKKKVTTEQDWFQMIEVGVSEQRDLQQFYKLCGFEAEATVDANANDEEAVAVEPRDFLTLDETDVADMIAQAAKELCANQVSPFYKHWACANRIKRDISGRQASKLVNPGIGKRNKHMGEVEEEEKKAVENDNDLEELFRKFTPRLRQIREVPAPVEAEVDIAAEALPAA